MSKTKPQILDASKITLSPVTMEDRARHLLGNEVVDAYESYGKKRALAEDNERSGALPTSPDEGRLALLAKEVARLRDQVNTLQASVNVIGESLPDLIRQIMGEQT